MIRAWFCVVQVLKVAFVRAGAVRFGSWKHFRIIFPMLHFIGLSGQIVRSRKQWRQNSARLSHLRGNSTFRDSLHFATSIHFAKGRIFALSLGTFDGQNLSSVLKAILGAIIISALINLLKQVKDMAYYWKLDKLDFVGESLWFQSSPAVDISTCID